MAAFGALGLHDGGNPGKAASTLAVRHHLVSHEVDVADQEESDPRRLGPGGGDEDRSHGHQDQAKGGEAADRDHGFSLKLVSRTLVLGSACLVHVSVTSNHSGVMAGPLVPAIHVLLAAVRRGCPALKAGHDVSKVFHLTERCSSTHARRAAIAYSRPEFR